MKKLRVLNMIGGIGSMTIGAKEQGYEVVGNIEWRPYYHTGTFEYNFPDAFMVKTLAHLTPEQEARCQDLDLIIGHTECGVYSNLNNNKEAIKDKNKNKGGIPQFVECVQRFRPKFFAMDNLPKSLTAATWEYWNTELPDYDIHFEWINNYGYGNIQKNRKRLFVIGSKKELGFYFIPNEFDHNETIEERLETLSENAPNNEKLDPDSIYPKFTRYNFEKEFCDKDIEVNRLTLRELQGYIKDIPADTNFFCYNRKGRIVKRIGYGRVSLNKHSQVLIGNPLQFRADDNYPFTIRERARIQGCPDDFIFLPLGVTKMGRDYQFLLKQTGKFMPTEFCSYLTAYIKDFIEGSCGSVLLIGERKLKPNIFVDSAKYNYCQNVGYTNQSKVCEYCGSKEFCQSQKKAELLWKD